LIKSFALVPPHGPCSEPFSTWNIDQIVTAIALSCPNLEDLNLNSCSQVTDKSLILLARHCRNLRKLNLNRCDLVSDLTLVELARNCRKLEIVNINRPLKDPRLNVSDAALAAVVREKPNITEIRMRNCDSLTDSTVAQLAISSGKKLKAVDLR
jgi:hypothetical protein